MFITANELFLSVVLCILLSLKTVKIMKTYSFLRPIQKFVEFNYPSLPDNYFVTEVCINELFRIEEQYLYKSFLLKWL